jgi:hypothetical protein
MEKINWRVIIVLFILSLVGIVSVLPYSLSVQSELIKELGISENILIISSIVQSAVLFFVLILVGYMISRKIGLGANIIEKWTEGKKIKKDIKNILPISIGLGLLVGGVLIGLDLIFYYLSGSGIEISTSSPGVLQGFLASFYGGINEEIMMRFFLMSLFILIINVIIKHKEEKPKAIVVWTSIIIASIIFGLGHLPFTSSVTAITPLIFTRAIALNGIAGIVFGWLYWKKGLESAIVSHFSADIGLHVILPAVILFG